MVDDLLPMLEPNEQVLYTRLFRLSYGFNRNYCTVSQSLLIERTGFSRNTIRTSLQSLVQKGWLRIAEAGNHVSTTYQVVLPRERRMENQGCSSNVEGQNLSLRNRPSQGEAHDMSRGIRGSESNPRGGQNLASQDLTLKKRPADVSIKTIPYEGGSNVEGQELPPLLKAFTNNSLTLLREESRSTPEGQDLTHNSLLLSARELVDKFYSSLGQRPSKIKRQKSIEECLNLLLEGFTVEEVDYAITWLIRHHPTTGAFSRLVHFIDQAIKERQTDQQAQAVDQAQAREAEHRHAEQQRMEEERRQIEEVKTSLPAEMLEGLYQEAKRLIEEESPHLTFGQDLMIQIKLNELVQSRYLP
jgi:Helix-turn-helix domain